MISLQDTRFPNATQGQPYMVNLTALLGVTVKELTGVEAVGLIFSKREQTVQGTPTTAGEFNLILTLDSKPFTQLTLGLIINPDPKSLWKTLEPDPSDPFPAPHFHIIELQGEAGKLQAASLRGRSHAHEGRFREDFMQVWQDESGTRMLLAVSDGAGSASLSRLGAKSACEAACERVSAGNLGMLQDSNPPTDLLTNAMFAAHNRLKLLAEEMKRPLRDFACTLSLASIVKTEQGYLISAIGIGDSPVILIDEMGVPRILHEPDSGEFGGETQFVTDDTCFSDRVEIQNRLQTALLSTFKALVCMTDGVYDPWFETQNGLENAEKWTLFWEDLKHKSSQENCFLDAESMLSWLNFWSRGNHDDRTLMIVTP